MTYWKKNWREAGNKTYISPADDTPMSSMDRAAHRGQRPRTEQSERAARHPARLFTTAEAADFLRLSARTLERYRVTGGGPRFVKLGPGKRARVVYREADLVAWLDGAVYEATSQYCS